MKKNLRKEMYGLLISIVVLIVLAVSVKTGVFHDVANWLGAKAMEPLNLK